MCRAYWTMIALSVALGALVTLALANRLLSALDEQWEEERRIALKAETAFLVRDTAEKGYVFDRDRAEWSVN